MKQYTPVTERMAANYLTGTLVAMLVGRFVSTQIMLLRGYQGCGLVQLSPISAKLQRCSDKLIIIQRLD